MGPRLHTLVEQPFPPSPRHHPQPPAHSVSNVSVAGASQRRCAQRVGELPVGPPRGHRGTPCMCAHHHKPLEAEGRALEGKASGGQPRVPSSSGGSTSGSRACCLGPGKHQDTCGKCRRNMSPSCTDTRAGRGPRRSMWGSRAVASQPSVPKEPSRLHPRPQPPPTAGKHHQAPTELERAGWGQGGGTSAQRQSPRVARPQGHL